MKKKNPSLKYSAAKDKLALQAPLPVYNRPSFLKKNKSTGPGSLKTMPAVLDFSYRKFEKIAKKIPFTQREWSVILHLSEKTLQRYAKDNKNFEGIYTDRILQMQELIDMGLEAFTSPEAFYRWLKREKPVLGELLSFDSLKTSEGIRLITDEIGRIMYGVYI
ncbi:MAG: antitoxin Xre/MbcA/ParS toxin-binding domain-containing protein [Bacteroidota bacterium]